MLGLKQAYHLYTNNHNDRIFLQTLLMLIREHHVTCFLYELKTSMDIHITTYAANSAKGARAVKSQQ